MQTDAHSLGNGDTARLMRADDRRGGAKWLSCKTLDEKVLKHKWKKGKKKMPQLVSSVWNSFVSLLFLDYFLFLFLLWLLHIHVCSRASLWVCMHKAFFPGQEKTCTPCIAVLTTTAAAAWLSLMVLSACGFYCCNSVGFARTSLGPKWFMARTVLWKRCNGLAKWDVFGFVCII